jgi:hypothetical protein
LRELGGHPETISAEDFARSIIVRKMEGDINRLESLNRPPSPWTTTQESQRKAQPTRKAKKAVPPQKTAESDPPEATKPPAEALPSPLPTSDFAKKMQNVLQDAARRPGQAP